MIKQKAGERKRTVTVVTGPITVALVAALGEKMNVARGNVPVSMTTLAGAGLDHTLREWCEIWSVTIPPSWNGHGS